MAEPTVSFQAKRANSGPMLERRAWVRCASDREASCQPRHAATMEDVETNWPGIIRDASPGGIGLILKRRFEPGTVLSVEVAVKPEGRCSFLARVVHATPYRKGRWVIGCAFARPIEQQELRIFLPEKQCYPPMQSTTIASVGGNLLDQRTS